MDTLPNPPPIEAPDFSEKLEAWLIQTGWSKYRLAELIGIDRKQIQRWTSSKRRQRPDGKAAQLYSAFRSATLVPLLRKEKSSLDSRIEALRRISFDAS